MNNTEVITSPLKAIRAKCLDCCCWQRNEVKLCTATSCTLHPFRFGKNPYRKVREYTEDEKQALATRLKASRKIEN